MTLLVVSFNSPIDLISTLLQQGGRGLIRLLEFLYFTLLKQGANETGSAFRWSLHPFGFRTYFLSAEGHAYGLFTQHAGPNRSPLLFVTQTVSLRTSGDLTLHGTSVAR